jgi:hypothetical protein
MINDSNQIFVVIICSRRKWFVLYRDFVPRLGRTDPLLGSTAKLVTL